LSRCRAMPTKLGLHSSVGWVHRVRMAIGVSGRSFSYGSPITTPARCGGALADQHVADRRNGPRRSQPRLCLQNPGGLVCRMNAGAVKRAKVARGV
jgi:hypothetical protein